MALTNAEKQARWRDRRKAEIERLRAEVEALIKRPAQGAETPWARLTPPPHRRGQMMMTNDTTVEVYKAIRAAVKEVLDRSLDSGQEAGPVADAALDAILYMVTLQGDEEILKRMRDSIADDLRAYEDGDEE
jgi:hypothetical protein